MNVVKQSPLAYVPLDATWSHWAIYGDGDLLDVIPERDAERAERFIEKNREIFASIRIHRARENIVGEFEIQQTRCHTVQGVKEVEG